jgi:ABC-2 type transport system permease protein
MTMATPASNQSTSTSTPTSGATSTLPDPGARAAFGSELLKLRSIPSIGIMLAVAVGLSALLSLLNAHDQSLVGPSFVPPGPGAVGTQNATVYAARVDPTGTLLSGYIVGAALFAAFGAIAGALEYSSGMIRISLAAVPRRARFFVSKASAVAATAFVAAAVCTLACFLVGESFFSGQPQVSQGLGSPGVPLHLAGAVVCLVGWTMIGFAFGMLLRSTALGVTMSLALYIAAPLVAESVVPSLSNKVTPIQTGQALWTYPSVLNPGVAPFGIALAVFLAYVIVLLAAAFTYIGLADA